jgi:hypothetical protein
VTPAADQRAAAGRALASVPSVFTDASMIVSCTARGANGQQVRRVGDKAAQRPGLPARGAGGASTAGGAAPQAAHLLRFQVLRQVEQQSSTVFAGHSARRRGS